MKRIITTAAMTAMIAAAGAVSADDGQSVTLQGTAAAECNLPTSWNFVSGNAGAGSSDFSGTTFMIPEVALVNADSTPVAGDGFAIRVRGMGFCNTSHVIAISSQRGGLRLNGDLGATPPQGFTNHRQLRYEAGWSTATTSTGPGENFGPTAQLLAQTPGLPVVASFLVGPTQDPPADRRFDVKISLQRPAGAPPLVAGNYSDNLLITLTPTP